MDEQQIYQNLMVFMDRVQVTGRQEVGAYAECINFLQSKVELKADEPQKADKKKAS